MKVKLGKLVVATQSGAFRQLMQTSMSPSMGITLSVLAKGVDEKLAVFHEAHKTLREKYQPEDPKAKLDPDTEAKMQAEFDEIMETVVDLPGISRIRASKLAAAGIQLRPDDVTALDWLIKQDMPLEFDAEDADD